MNVRINLYKKRGPFDVLGWLLATQQRSAITHANIQIDDVCWTTGARWDFLKGPVFGQAPAEKYNAGRQYYQCEFVAPLNDDELASLIACCKGFEGQRYGLGKVLKLDVAGNVTPDFICQLGRLDLNVKNPFCSEAVVAICWHINRLVCQWLCRKEPSVCTPNDLYLEADRGTILKIVNTVGF